MTDPILHPDSIDIDRKLFLRLEQVGMREKKWLKREDKDQMFKENLRITTGEDWAEVLAAEICQLLEMPHAKYKFAHSTDKNDNIVKGVLTESMVETNQNLILANELLLTKNPDYPLNTDRYYKTREHCMAAISSVLNLLKPPLTAHSAAYSSKEHYAGYLFLDAIIGNQDRHHQNWGAILSNGHQYLAPTFDHAASFAQNVTEIEKTNRLNTNDEGYSIPVFASRARSAIFESENKKRTMTTRKAYHYFCELNQIDSNIWLSTLDRLSEKTISAIIEDVGRNIMSDVCKRFTLQYILENIRYFKK